MILRPLGLICLGAILLLGASMSRPGAARAAEPRLGLVIGEASYKAGALSTPANDAGLIAQALASDGFDVTGYADLDLPGTRRAFSDFLGKAREAGRDAVVFVYLAGYGLQFSGDNFFVPVDARIARDVDVPAEAVRLSDLSRDLAALPLKARILVYDLAHPHPFASGGTPLAGGLAVVAPQAGSLVAFNTAPGLVAGVEQGDYGLYAQALSEMLQTKGLSMDTISTRLRARIDALSNGAAVPWAEGTLETPFVPLPPATDAPSLLSPLRALMPAGAADAYWAAIQRDTPAAYSDFLKAYPRDPQGPRIATLLAARREAQTWAQTLRANVAAAYWSYMRRYPRGPHFADARRGLAALPAALEPPPRFDPYVYSDLPTPRPEELALINRPAVLLDADDEVLVPPPPPSVVPDRRVEFYDRLPPLLAVGAGTLPLNVPLSAAPEPGRVLQPDFSGLGGPVVASAGVDKSGEPTLRQTAQDGKMLSAAIQSAGPNGGSIVTQTGPDNALVMKTVAVTGPNGARTVTQTGPDKQVIEMVTTLVAANGNRVTTVSGSDGLPRSIVTSTSAGTVLKRTGPEGIVRPPALMRPVVVPAAPKSATAAAPPPLLATAPTPPVDIARPGVTAATHPATPPQASSISPAPAVDARPSAVPPLVMPNEVVVPRAPGMPSVAPASVPEPVAPEPKPIAPIAIPTIVAPASPPSTLVPTTAAPSPAATAPALPSHPAASLAEPKSEPLGVAEPVPPRKAAEPAAATALPPQPPADKRGAVSPPQPTPPQRPKAAPAKAAPAKAAPVKAAAKTSHTSAKPAVKKAPGPRRPPGKHRR